MAVWFDVHNINHCKAYRHLQRTGEWPEGVDFHDTHTLGSMWQVTLMSQMTKAWVDQMLEDNDEVVRLKERQTNGSGA